MIIRECNKQQRRCKSGKPPSRCRPDRGSVSFLPTQMLLHLSLHLCLSYLRWYGRLDARVVLLNFKLNSVKLKLKITNEFNSRTGEKSSFSVSIPLWNEKMLRFRTLSLKSNDPNKSGVRTIATPRLGGLQELCFLSVSAWKTTSQLHPHMAERFQGRGHMWTAVTGGGW